MEVTGQISRYVCTKILFTVLIRLPGLGNDSAGPIRSMVPRPPAVSPAGKDACYVLLSGKSTLENCTWSDPIFTIKRSHTRTKNLIRKHWEGCAASVNGDSLRDGGLGGFLNSFFSLFGLPDFLIVKMGDRKSTRLNSSH